MCTMRSPSSSFNLAIECLVQSVSTQSSHLTLAQSLAKHCFTKSLDLHLSHARMKGGFVSGSGSGKGCGFQDGGGGVRDGGEGG